MKAQMWNDLPCEASLDAVARFCPDGWAEVYREHPGKPPEVMKVWGVEPERAATFARELWRVTPLYQWMPSNSTAILKLLPAEGRQPWDETFLVDAFAVTAAWGLDERAVWAYGRASIALLG